MSAGSAIQSEHGQSDFLAAGDRLIAACRAPGMPGPGRKWLNTAAAANAEIWQLLCRSQQREDMPLRVATIGSAAPTR